MKFIIPRKKWLRGEGAEYSFLLRLSDNKMCCLGHFGLACGLDSERMKNAMSPEDIAFHDGGDIEVLWTKNTLKSSFLFCEPSNIHDPSILSKVCMRLMEINDDIYISDADREQMIINIFAQHGIEVIFEG